MPRRISRRSVLAKATAGLSLLPLAACSPAESEKARLGRLTSGLQAEIPALLSAAHVPGLAMAIVSNGRLAWAQGFGVKHSVSRLPVDAETLFEAGSVSKTVFAYAVMKLCEKGVLNLDTPLVKYVPDRWITDDPRFDLITTRHVLSHTSGLQNWRSAQDPLRIHFTPGSKWQYSGEGYSFLQLVVSRLAGYVDTQTCEKMFDGLTVCSTNIDAYLRANLLRPFRMPTSRYVWDRSLEQSASPHDKDGKPIDRAPPNSINASRYGAAGGLGTSAAEYARFLVEVLNPQSIDMFRLTRASRAEMLRPQIKADGNSSWALGWQILHDEKMGDLLSHGGDNPGFKAYVLASAERRSGYVILTNGDNFEGVFKQLVFGDTPLNQFVTG